MQGNVATLVAEVMSKARATFGTKPDVIFFLLHGANIPLYKAVKDSCDVTFGLASRGMLVKAITLGYATLTYLVILVDKALNERGQQQ